MTAQPGESYEQFPLPIEVCTFTEAGAQQLHELSLYYGVNPEQIIKYGLGILDEAMRSSQENGTEFVVAICPKDDSDKIIKYLSPQEARTRGAI